MHIYIYKYVFKSLDFRFYAFNITELQRKNILQSLFFAKQSFIGARFLIYINVIAGMTVFLYLFATL